MEHMIQLHIEKLPEGVYLATSDDTASPRALEELEFFSREVRILGVYPAHPFRQESQSAGA